MFSPETGVFSANKVLRELVKSGQVGYIETNKTRVDMLPEDYEGVVEISFEDGQATLTVPLTAGTTYEMVLDGVSYVRKAFDHEFMGESAVALGNVSALGGEDTGEPFLCVNGFMCIVSELGTGASTTHTISLYEYRETETIHPIDPKYIPDLDALYLNGTDGKQYKVTVSDDGALTATEVTP